MVNHPKQSMSIFKMMSVCIGLIKIAVVTIFLHFYVLSNICVFQLLVAPKVNLLKYFKSNTITVKKGAAIEIPAEIAGLPLPTFKWTKDEVVLEKSTETLTLESEELNRQTIKTMIAIPETIRQDTGLYNVSATNIHGTGQQIIRVDILGMIICLIICFFPKKHI